MSFFLWYLSKKTWYKSSWCFLLHRGAILTSAAWCLCRHVSLYVKNQNRKEVRLAHLCLNYSGFLPATSHFMQAALLKQMGQGDLFSSTQSLFFHQHGKWFPNTWIIERLCKNNSITFHMLTNKCSFRSVYNHAHERLSGEHTDFHQGVWASLLSVHFSIPTQKQPIIFL